MQNKENLLQPTDILKKNKSFLKYLKQAERKTERSSTKQRIKAFHKSLKGSKSRKKVTFNFKRDSEYLNKEKFKFLEKRNLIKNSETDEHRKSLKDLLFPVINQHMELDQRYKGNSKKGSIVYNNRFSV